MAKDKQEFDDVEFSGPVVPEDDRDDDLDVDDQDDADDDQDDDSDEAGEEDDGDEEDGEDGEDDGGKDAASDDEPPAKDRKKRSAQERIKELARARRESEKAAYEAELRTQELERQLAERGEVSTEAELPKEPDPKDFRYGEVDSGYIDAVVEYRLAKKEFEGQTERKTRAEQERASSEAEWYRQRLADVMTKGTKKYSGFREAVENTVYDPALARMVLDSDNAVDIAYHLSKNVRDLRDLTRATPQERLRKLGRLEGRLSAPSAAKKTSAAPRTPGSKGRKVQDRSSGRFGPDNQDDFDKAFFGQ